MNSRKINKKEIEDLLINKFGHPFTLSNGQYHKFDLNSQTYFAYTSKVLHSTTSGYIIAECPTSGSEGDLMFMPSILNLFLEIPILKIEDKSLIELLTYGEPIEYNNSNLFSLVIDKLGSIVALVKRQGKIMVPLIDIGSYLRNE